MSRALAMTCRGSWLAARSPSALIWLPLGRLGGEMAEAAGLRWRRHFSPAAGRKYQMAHLLICGLTRLFWPVAWANENGARAARRGE